MFNKKYKSPAKVLRALGHPIRLSIAKGLLKQKSCNVSKIVTGLKIPQSTVSQHLNTLKAAGVIKGERKGVKVCYSVANTLVKRILKYI